MFSWNWRAKIWGIDMFLRSFKNTFKLLLRQKAMLFWALLFPIVLGIFFKLAFGNITENSKFKTIDVAVNETLMQDDNFKNFMNEMEDEKYFKVVESKNEDILNTNEDVKAYIDSMDKIYTKKSGISETIVETIMNSYSQKVSMITKIMQKNPTADIGKILNVDDHIKDISRKNMDPVNVFFYTLLGMTTIYGYMWGLFVSFQYEANLSTNAKRNAVSPTKKSVMLSASVLVSWIINFAITVLFIAYLKYALGVGFGDRIGALIGLASISSLCGVTFGILIGVSNKASLDTKIGMGIAITMLMSFLAGMMVPEIKVIIAEKLPVINKINPVAVVTDAVYSLYYYDSMARFNKDIINLLIITVVFVVASLFFMRGKEYESL